MPDQTLFDAANALAEATMHDERERVDEIDRRYRVTDPDTSRQAAEANAPRAPRHRDLALRTLRQWPAGLTDFELAELTGIAQTSVGKRRGELRDLGLVDDSGLRRPSPSGAHAIVWRIAT